MPGFSRTLAELAELAGVALDSRAAQVLLRALTELHDELTDQVTKAEFRQLTTVVEELAEAQHRTEQRLEELAEAQKRSEGRLDRLEAIVQELAEAQKRTEKRVEELAEAQKRTEKRVEELAEAQKRTEKRVEELAEAQKRTEKRVEELAEAQKRTEAEVRGLAVALKKTRVMVGGLSDAVGYVLEDRAIRSLPALLPELAGVEAQGKFVRRWVTDRDGQQVELNIFGYGRRKLGEEVTVVGEAKARARVKDVDNLRRLLERLEGVPEVRGSLLGVLVSYQVRREVEERAGQVGVLVVPSYLLPT